MTLLAPADEHAFNAVGATVLLTVSDAQLDAAVSPLVTNNDELVNEGLVTASPASLQITALLTADRNDVEIDAVDQTGAVLHWQRTLWAGSHLLAVQVVDAAGNPVSGAQVTISLAEATSVRAEQTSVLGGNASFGNLPDRTIVIEARTAGGAFGSFATNGGAGTARVVVRGFQPASPVHNNNFSLGTTGWVIGTAPVQIIPHTESLATDMDLELSTLGIGPQTVSRTFQVVPGTKAVTVRHRFITTELSGGFFGSQFNDLFSVTIRSLAGGGLVHEGNSMNGLGLAAFNAAGATAWREASLPLALAGDTVQVEVTVANVADGAYDSQVIVDFVEEKQLAITTLEMFDIDNSPLQYLSASPHSYFNGNTRVHGKMTVEGPGSDSLAELQLEIVQGGAVVATGNLANTAAGILLRSFGPAGKVEIASAQLLFEIPSTALARIDVSTDGTLSLRVSARSEANQQATRDAAPVQILARYEGTNRYGPRDEGVGGDDWVLPSVRSMLSSLSLLSPETGVKFNDMSNMNGGEFRPHGSHVNGRDVDGKWPGYEARDAATADTMINYLNSPAGQNIKRVFVTYTRATGNPFWDRIKDVTLVNGESARDVIRRWPHHTDHFHWRFVSQSR